MTLMKHVVVPQALLNEQTLLNTVDVEKLTAEEKAAHDALVADLQERLSHFGDVPMTPDEETALLAEQAASQAAAVISTLKAQAQAALDSSDMTALRCVKAGVAFPEEWQTYVTALRDIVSSGTGTIPDRPAYPAGT